MISATATILKRRLTSWSVLFLEELTVANKLKEYHYSHTWRRPRWTPWFKGNQLICWKWTWVPGIATSTWVRHTCWVESWHTAPANLKASSKKADNNTTSLLSEDRTKPIGLELPLSVQPNALLSNQALRLEHADRMQAVRPGTIALIQCKENISTWQCEQAWFQTGFNFQEHQGIIIHDKLQAVDTFCDNRT